MRSLGLGVTHRDPSVAAFSQPHLTMIEVVMYPPAMIITAHIHKAAEGGFWAEVPALPGCATQGETMEELQANLREAVQAWLEAGTPEPAEDGAVLELAM